MRMHHAAALDPAPNLLMRRDPPACCCLLSVPQAEDSSGGQVDHVGAMFFSFLRRYGVDWDINRDAVAVGQGGIVTRDSLATVEGPFAGNDKLAVKDPLTGV